MVDTLASYVAYDVPFAVFSNAVASVTVVPLPGKPKALVFAYALDGADPDTIAEQFQAKCVEAFGYHKFRFSRDADWDIRFVVDAYHGLALDRIYEKHRDNIIAWYRANRPDLFHPDYGDPDYDEDELRTLVLDMIKHRLRRARQRLVHAIE